MERYWQTPGGVGHPRLYHSRAKSQTRPDSFRQPSRYSIFGPLILQLLEFLLSSPRLRDAKPLSHECFGQHDPAVASCERWLDQSTQWDCYLPVQP